MSSTSMTSSSCAYSFLSVPFGIDKTSGKVGLVKDVGGNALDFYKLKVNHDKRTHNPVLHLS
jgi:hypothetical protein